jgi:Xaa-Pro aminopeptidase
MISDLSELPAPRVSGRLDRLRDAFEEAGCDGLLVTKLENIRYLTGFSGSAAMLLVTRDGALLTTDGRYAEQSEEQVRQAGVDTEITIGRLDGQLAAIEQRCTGIARLGLEAAVVSWAQQQRLADRLASRLVSTTGLVEGLRVVKDEGELARIEMACDIADVALAQVKERLAEGVTETEFAAELEFEMRRRGAQGPAFETIVAAGPNSAMPHHRPTDRRVEEGELVVVDFGATVDGYRSDMTRTFVVGQPEAALSDLLDAVLAAQRAGVRKVRAGARAAEVDEACRASLNEAGYGEFFLHSTGHGVGLEIHEAPAVAQGAADILATGSVVTVEPGAYLAMRGGVRIEDSLVVTDDGSRVLTKSTKDHLL